MAKGANKAVEVTDPALILAAEQAEASRERALIRDSEHQKQAEAEAAEIERLDKIAADQKTKHDADVKSGLVENGGKLVRIK